MFRIIRTRTLTARAAELDTLRQQATQAQDAATRALASAAEAEKATDHTAELRAVIQQVTRERDDARAERDQEHAEAEGAPRSGWTSLGPGAAMPPAAEVPWRIQPLPLGGVQK
ncbi:hypothetical protein ABZ628_28805 [Streptomyces diastaticus]|uniref:hypothetical protein n=1 Tax=Streptomyces diastaticus TaxID=1956 RepID=UPI0033C32383